MNKDNTAPLSAEDLAVLDKCKVLAYGEIGKKIAEIDDEYHRGNITKEERNDAVGNLNTVESYSCFVSLVVEKLGFYPDKRTRLIDERYFGEEVE